MNGPQIISQRFEATVTVIEEELWETCDPYDEIRRAIDRRLDELSEEMYAWAREISLAFYRGEE